MYDFVAPFVAPRVAVAIRQLLSDGQWHFREDIRKELGVCGECKRPFMDDDTLKVVLATIEGAEFGSKARVKLVV